MINRQIDVVAAAEARGFIFAAPLALELGVGFVPVRKPGKLPFDTHAFHYELEYGTDTLEIHSDGIAAGQRVLLVDDLLATGGTMEACCRLIEHAGGTVGGLRLRHRIEGASAGPRASRALQTIQPDDIFVAGAPSLALVRPRCGRMLNRGERFTPHAALSHQWRRFVAFLLWLAAQSTAHCRR